MLNGTVKWYNPTKGYGFISPSEGDKSDVFVHKSALEESGMKFLNEGEKVSFEMATNKGKVSAVNLKKI